MIAYERAMKKKCNLDKRTDLKRLLVVINRALWGYILHDKAAQLKLLANHLVKEPWLSSVIKKIPVSDAGSRV